MLPQTFIVNRLTRDTDLTLLTSWCPCGNKTLLVQKYGPVTVKLRGIDVDINQIVHSVCHVCFSIVVFPESAEKFQQACSEFLTRHHPGTQYIRDMSSSTVNIYERIEPVEQEDHTDTPDNKFIEGGREFTRVKEEMRRYIYPGKEFLDHDNVSAIHVSKSGNHYLIYGESNQFRAIVAPGWREIVLVGTSEWTF